MTSSYFLNDYIDNEDNWTDFYQDIKIKILNIVIAGYSNDIIRIPKEFIISRGYTNKIEFEEQFLLKIFKDVEKITGKDLDEIKFILKDKIKFEQGY
jgi:hypothetical protein